MVNRAEQFLQELTYAFQNERFVKLSIGKKAYAGNDLTKILVKPVIIKNERKVSVVYRYTTQDITKNYDIAELTKHLKEILGKELMDANLFTLDADIQLLISAKGKEKMRKHEPTFTALPSLSHDKKKKRKIDSDKKYLADLGVLNNEGKVKPGMGDKFRQINRYIELLEPELIQMTNKQPLRILDMGSGKGYLTFAVYDFLVNRLKKDAKVIGVEQNTELVKKCNQIAESNGFDALEFSQGNIYDYQTDGVDLLIALHACDTATDEAIYQGITNDAQMIVVAPCCHKQIRNQMEPRNEMKPILKHGIFRERQAELVTDGIRVLLMESMGYKTKTQEFISLEHTPKNIMITGVKSHKPVDTNRKRDKVEALKRAFGISWHYLEKLLNEDKGDWREYASCEL